jgi:hypothetical protein
MSLNARSAIETFDAEMDSKDIKRMVTNAQNAANFLKVLGHEGRLMILCHLASG